MTTLAPTSLSGNALALALVRTSEGGEMKEGGVSRSGGGGEDPSWSLNRACIEQSLHRSLSPTPAQ